jgi:hypothetical protein
VIRAGNSLNGKEIPDSLTENKPMTGEIGQVVIGSR